MLHAQIAENIGQEPESTQPLRCVFVCLHLSILLFCDVPQQPEQIKSPPQSRLRLLLWTSEVFFPRWVAAKSRTRRETRREWKTEDRVQVFIFFVCFYMSPAEHDDLGQLVPQDNPLSAAHDIGPVCTSACILCVSCWLKMTLQATSTK